MEGPFAITQALKFPRSSSVGKALEVLVGSRQDMG